jgi:hypothetical protein
VTHTDHQLPHDGNANTERGVLSHLFEPSLRILVVVVAIAPPTTTAVAVPVATVAMVLVSARHPSPHAKKRVELARRRTRHRLCDLWFLALWPVNAFGGGGAVRQKGLRASQSTVNALGRVDCMARVGVWVVHLWEVVAVHVDDGWRSRALACNHCSSSLVCWTRSHLLVTCG